MRVALVGSDYEENLGVAMIAASLLEARHQVQVVAFNEARELETVAERILRYRPKVVGLGMQFQHRSADFLQLALELRNSGYDGHITCGGQYPSMAWVEVIENEPSVDSIVLHEGESSIVELCETLQRGRELDGVAGLALRTADGRARRTAPRPLCADLDSLPFAYRYREPARHMGLAFRPIWGSRGCWGSCAFCSITSYYRDAHKYGGGRKLRLRTVESLAKELAALYHAEGDTTLFCFHDETLLLPRPADSIARLTELRDKLDALGVGQLGIIGKCRPDCVTPELAKALRRLGVVRMFVGVENGSQRGLDNLHRRTTLEQIEQALSAYEAAGIFVCYNLLLFEPDSTLEDVRGNVEFMRKRAHIPVNFCRAEPYHGTPLYELVKARGTLLGSHLGWDYRIHDDRTELAFRISAAVFRERNFDAEGVANRSMGLGYTAQLLRCFYNVNTVRGQRLLERTRRVTEDIVLDTARFLEQAVEIAEKCDLSDHDAIARQTALLGLQVASHNRASHAVLDDLIEDLSAYVAEQPHTRVGPSIPERAKATLEKMALAGCFAASVQACGGESSDPAPGPSGGATHTGGSNATGSTASGGYFVADPPPASGGRSATGGSNAIYGDGGAPPTTGGRTSSGGSKATGGMLVVDMAPSTGGRVSSGGFVSTGGYYSEGMTGGRTSTGGVKATGGRNAGGVGGGDSVPWTGGRMSTGGFGVGGMVVDMAPQTGGRSSSGGTAATGGIGVVDMVPPTGGRSSVSTGGMFSDPLPPATGGQSISASISSTRANALYAGNVVVDTSRASLTIKPADEKDSALACSVDPAPPECTSGMLHNSAVVENWRDSSPKRFIRSSDLALFDPPDVKLQAQVLGSQVRVRLCSSIAGLSCRWESEGTVEGEGREVLWTPAHDEDALCVAARGSGGITVAMLRATDVGRT